MAKLLSADIFELYIFSFEIFPMGVSFVLARVVIAFELFLGVWMISNLHARLSAAAGIFTLAGFSAFLIWLMLRGDQGSCHCFGELVDFTPGQSLIKNMAMTALLLPCLWGRSFNIRHRGMWTALIFLASFATVFIISVPDNFRFSQYGRSYFNEEAFDSAVESGQIPSNTLEGNKIVCFFGTGCHFCQMTSQKLGILLRTDALEPYGGVDFSDAGVVCVFPDTDDPEEPTTSDFLEATRLECSEVLKVTPETIVKVTHGSMPMVLLMHDGSVVKEFGYRDLH